MVLKKLNAKAYQPFVKENIYVTGHSSNADIISIIAAEIQKIQQTSTIYLDTDSPKSIDDYDEENIFTILNMNLIVFVITSKFFAEDCLAGTFLFEYALKNNVSILPVMAEKNLENKFNERFGNLHLLLKPSYNYPEKLKEFIDEKFNNYHAIDDPFLVDECISSQIFISYRKKNRMAADSAICLMRSYNFLRDVKIWYDDFLHEGENYDEDIEKQLKNSDIFVLIVTPDLLQPGNYVLDIEYPSAIKNNKYILALLTENTDMKLFSEKYDNVNKIVAVNDRNAVGAAIYEALEIKGKQPEKYPYSADKLYVLGRAFIDGDIMERDFKLGFSMLVDAAKTGSMEAFGRIGKIWSEGKEVPRDYGNAISCYADECRLFQNYMNRIIERIDQLSDEDMYSLKLKLSAQISLLHDYYTACIMQGEKERGKSALLLCEQYQEWYELNNPPILSAKYNLGTTYLKLGAFYKGEKIHDRALEYYQKAHDYLQKKQKVFKGTPQYEKSLFMLYYESGNLYYELFMSSNHVSFLPPLVHYYVQALKKGVEVRCVYNLLDTEIFIRDSAQKLFSAAALFEKIDDIESAVDIYKNLNAQYDILSHETHNPDDYSFLASIKVNLAVAGKPENGYELLLESCRITDNLSRAFPENAIYSKSHEIAKKYLSEWK